MPRLQKGCLVQISRKIENPTNVWTPFSFKTVYIKLSDPFILDCFNKQTVKIDYGDIFNLSSKTISSVWANQGISEFNSWLKDENDWGIFVRKLNICLYNRRVTFREDKITFEPQMKKALIMLPTSYWLVPLEALSSRKNP